MDKMKWREGGGRSIPLLPEFDPLELTTSNMKRLRKSPGAPKWVRELLHFWTPHRSSFHTPLLNLMLEVPQFDSSLLDVPEVELDLDESDELVLELSLESSTDRFFFLPPSNFRVSLFALVRSFLCIFLALLLLLFKSSFLFCFNQAFPAVSIGTIIHHTSQIISPSDVSSYESS